MKGMKEIKFNTRWELVKHLHDEGPLMLKSGAILFWEESSPNPIRVKNPRALDESSPGVVGIVGIDATYYIPPLWYENIPEGKYVPCWVSDTQAKLDQSTDFAVVEYAPKGSKDYPFRDTAGRRYAYAKPRTDIWIPE